MIKNVSTDSKRLINQGDNEKRMDFLLEGICKIKIELKDAADEFKEAMNSLFAKLVSTREDIQSQELKNNQIQEWNGQVQTRLQNLVRGIEVEVTSIIDETNPGRRTETEVFANKEFRLGM